VNAMVLATVDKPPAFNPRRAAQGVDERGFTFSRITTAARA